VTHKPMSLQLGDIMNLSSREGLMFDSSFERSHTYFTVLQLLRIFTESIEETAPFFSFMVTHWTDTWARTKTVKPKSEWHYRFDEATYKIIMHNWEIVRSTHKLAMERLLERIGKKTEEVKSLRDGVSSRGHLPTYLLLLYSPRYCHMPDANCP